MAAMGHMDTYHEMYPQYIVVDYGCHGAHQFSRVDSFHLTEAWCLLTDNPPPCNQAPARKSTLWLYTFGYIHYSIALSVQSVETNYIFLDRKMAKNILVRVCSGMLFSLEEDRDFVICDNKDKM